MATGYTRIITMLLDLENEERKWLTSEIGGYNTAVSDNEKVKGYNYIRDTLRAFESKWHSFWECVHKPPFSYDTLINDLRDASKSLSDIYPLASSLWNHVTEKWFIENWDGKEIE